MANLARIAARTASPLLIGTGAAAWAAITAQLKNERITVLPDSEKMGGKPVAGPISAFAQANVIAGHQAAMAEGRTFAEVSEDYMEALNTGDTERAEALAGPREQLMQGNFVRASLFTSVLAYGLAALTMGLGVLTGVTASGLKD